MTSIDKFAYLALAMALIGIFSFIVVEAPRDVEPVKYSERPVKFERKVVESETEAMELRRNGASWTYKFEVFYFDHPRRADYECMMLVAGRNTGLTCIPKEKK